MLSTIPPLGSLKFNLPARPCPKGPLHHDCYTSGHSHPPEIYNRQMSSHFALATPQMGDANLDSFPSARFSTGEEPAGQQTQWSDHLGEVPKDRYWCRDGGGTITGKCSNDRPEWGSGSDYMGNKCSSCGGTGVCPHCHGDGIMG
ncbi:MAG: hypothetical protein KF760_33730 [Candidatus Eremiobacteraeota bacterium]|nr:hypothetical protein [Candidatus Eremiobacteraeota bacterium]MCW5869863.1 hypothetical protein [Candidatus Eremiobacteraeota bacterium]